MNNTMDSNSTQNNSQPVYCANNCGFFGNPMFQNMCSKCFRDQQKSSNTSASTSNTSNSGKEAVAANSLQQHESFISHGSEVKVEIDPSSRPDTADSSCTSETTSAAAGLNNDSKEQEQQQQQQANPSRCFICKSKITLAKQISNKCRCSTFSLYLYISNIYL